VRLPGNEQPAEEKYSCLVNMGTLCGLLAAVGAKPALEEVLGLNLFNVHFWEQFIRTS
jgi:hypothetical protein